jgi:hypothetical protein
MQYCNQLQTTGKSSAIYRTPSTVQIPVRHCLIFFIANLMLRSSLLVFRGWRQVSPKNRPYTENLLICDRLNNDISGMTRGHGALLEICRVAGQLALGHLALGAGNATQVRVTYWRDLGAEHLRYTQQWRPSEPARLSYQPLAQ